MTLQVVGAGFGRTGTLSLKVALEKLGFPCHHMMEVFQNDTQHIQQWVDAFENDGKDANWDSIFKGYTACVDFPACVFYKELLEKYPEAVCILSVRDPESWWGSASETILDFSNMSMVKYLGWFSEKRRLTFQMLFKMFFKTFQTLEINKELAIQVFNKHNEEVKRTVPAKKLLVFSVKEGWKPLCEFLNVPIPNEPFPNVNDKKDFKNRVKKSRYAVYGILAAITSMAIAVPLIYRKLRSR